MGLIANDIYKGSEDVYKMYEGDSLIYEKASNGIMDYFHIWAAGGPAGKVGHVSFEHGYGSNDHKNVKFEYSYDGITWSYCDWTFTGIDLDLNINYDENTGDPIYEYIFIRGNNIKGVNVYSGDGDSIISPNYFYINDTTQDHNAHIHVGGNIMSLMYGDDFRDKYTIPSSNCFNYLFKGDLYSAAELKLPATSLTDHCYKGMFSKNERLVYGPKFLPANNLVGYCYREMFYQCYNLIQAPAIPSKNLGEGCYYRMFSFCTSLTTAPVLPAKKIMNGSYWDMFFKCSRLNYVKILAEDLGNANTFRWLNGVSSEGTFVKKKGVNYSNDASGIPVGWTVEEID